MDLKFFVDESKCIRCGACIRDCAVDVLEMDPATEFPRVIPGTEAACTRCQHCLAVCPVGAVEIFGRDPEESLPGLQFPDPDGVARLIANRRSYRSYRKENLDRETLDRLKDMLRFVPTGVNAHLLHFAFVEDVAVMDRIRNDVNEKIQHLLAHEPDSPFLGWMSRYRRQLEEGRDVIFRGAPHMVVAAVAPNAPCAVQDPIIALSYFELYAQSLGVGSCWCGLANGTFQAFPELAALLRLPAGYKIGYAMLFGPTGLEYPRAVQPDPVGITVVK